MQTAFSTDGARPPCHRPRATGSHLPAVLPSARLARPPGRPPAQRAAQRSGTVGLAGAWVKSPPPQLPSTWEAQGEPSRPPESFAAAPSEPPQPRRLPVTSHRFCPCPASEPAACRLPTGLRQPLARWRGRGWSPERGEPTVFQGGACSREAARGRRTDTSAGTA